MHNRSKLYAELHILKYNLT